MAGPGAASTIAESIMESEGPLRRSSAGMTYSSGSIQEEGSAPPPTQRGVPPKPPRPGAPAALAAGAAAGKPPQRQQEHHRRESSGELSNLSAELETQRQQLSEAIEAKQAALRREQRQQSVAQKEKVGSPQHSMLACLLPVVGVLPRKALVVLCCI